jgi:acyl-CoA hydrolase
MLGESYKTMVESGKMNNMKKTLDRGKTVFTFEQGPRLCMSGWTVTRPWLHTTCTM